MQDIQATLRNGSLVRGRYEVVRLLGRGGFSAVYLVRDLRVQGNHFALKEVVAPSKAERQRFTFEGELLKRLDHPALPRVYRAFEDDASARAYLLMDYIAGPNLEVLRQQQPGRRFSLPQVMTMMAPLIEAVDYLHQQRPPLIHRDIKPSNIIVPSGGGGSVLVDFGIAKEYEQESTTTAVRHGSPGYSAPEQYTRGTNPRTDVYELAATCYALLTGTVPADAVSRMAQVGSQKRDPLIPVKQLVPALPTVAAEAIEQAMAINSTERFASAAAFWRALQATSVGEKAVGDPEAHRVPSGPAATTAVNIPVSSGARSPRPRVRSSRVALPLAFIALIALLAGVFWGSHLLALRQAPVPSTPRAIVTQAPRSSRPTASPPTVPARTSSVPAQGTPAGAPSPSARSTSRPAARPQLQAMYSGTIYNAPLAIRTTLSLSQLRQSGATVSGYLTVGPQLQGSGTFTGLVANDRGLRFLVQSHAGHLPLLFTGRIDAKGNLSGSYCSFNGNQCDNAGGGYGTWSAAPLALGS